MQPVTCPAQLVEERSFTDEPPGGERGVVVGQRHDDRQQDIGGPTLAVPCHPHASGQERGITHGERGQRDGVQRRSFLPSVPARARDDGSGEGPKRRHASQRGTATPCPCRGVPAGRRGVRQRAVLPAAEPGDSGRVAPQQARDMPVGARTGPRRRAEIERHHRRPANPPSSRADESDRMAMPAQGRGPPHAPRTRSSCAR